MIPLHNRKQSFRQFLLHALYHGEIHLHIVDAQLVRLLFCQESAYLFKYNVSDFQNGTVILRYNNELVRRDKSKFRIIQTKQSLCRSDFFSRVE